MAMGIPVVASQEAVKGIDASPGEHLLVGHDADTFACHVIDVMRDQHLRWRLAEAGRQKIEVTHNWANSMKILDNLVTQRTAKVEFPELRNQLGQVGMPNRVASRDRQ
jgi:hypothetical protein